MHRNHPQIVGGQNISGGRDAIYRVRTRMEFAVYYQHFMRTRCIASLQSAGIFDEFCNTLPGSDSLGRTCRAYALDHEIGRTGLISLGHIDVRYGYIVET